jgi:hypothetical protein
MIPGQKEDPMSKTICHEDSGEIKARGNVQVSYRDDPGTAKNGNVRIKLENRRPVRVKVAFALDAYHAIRNNQSNAGLPATKAAG